MRVSGIRFPRGTPFNVRFWSGVDFRSRNECWEWRRSRVGKKRQYGSIGLGTTGKMRAHRAAWELTNGPIPEGLEVCHKCDNPPCCNPTHLFLGTSRDNHHDRARKGRLAGACRRRLTEDQVSEIARLRVSGEKCHVIAMRFGVTRQTVSQITCGQTWAWREKEAG